MLSVLDIAIVFLYAISLFTIAPWVSQEESGYQKYAQAYPEAMMLLPSGSQGVGFCRIAGHYRVVAGLDDQ